MAQLQLENANGYGWYVDSTGNMVPNAANVSGGTAGLGTTGTTMAVGGTINFATHTPSSTPATAANGSLIGCGGTWISFATAGAAGVKFLLRNTCATGEFASLRVRASANNTTASGNGGNSVGTNTAGDFSASAYKADYGNLFAINACAQPNALAQTTDSTNIVCALYGRIDATAASVGRRWVSWIDTHATTKASGGDYMVRISHNGTIANDGCFTIYTGGRLPVLFNIEDAAGFLQDTSQSLSTQAGAIAVKTPAGTRYLALYSS